MGSNKAGGLRAATTNKAKYGKDFYVKIGAMGGKADQGRAHLKGFGSNPDLAERANKLGIAARRKNKKAKA